MKARSLGGVPLFQIKGNTSLSSLVPHQLFTDSSGGEFTIFVRDSGCHSNSIKLGWGSASHKEKHDRLSCLAQSNHPFGFKEPVGINPEGEWGDPFAPSNLGMLT